MHSSSALRKLFQRLHTPTDALQNLSQHGHTPLLHYRDSQHGRAFLSHYRISSNMDVLQLMRYQRTTTKPKIRRVHPTKRRGPASATYASSSSETLPTDQGSTCGSETQRQAVCSRTIHVRLPC